MGMDQRVHFPGESVPPWSAVRDLLCKRGFPVQLRMIDGQLSFPDELPPDDWKELRTGTPHGMITVRREPGQVVLVTWGNADAALQQAWNVLTWAYAFLSDGRVQNASAAEYARTASLPPGLCADDVRES